MERKLDVLQRRWNFISSETLNTFAKTFSGECSFEPPAKQKCPIALSHLNNLEFGNGFNTIGIQRKENFSRRKRKIVTLYFLYQ